MGDEQLGKWLGYMQFHPLDITQNIQAAILASLTGSDIEQCGGVIQFKPISTDELKEKLRHLVRGNGWATNGKHKENNSIKS